MTTRVAVLGGGMGSLAAALELSHPRHNGAYEVTVYQKDWMLGGKGASTRNGQPGMGARVEEHGLHLLVGFYEHAFKLLRSVYDDARGGPWPDLPSFDNMIIGWDTVWMGEEYPEGRWRNPWKVTFPPNDRVPGVAETSMSFDQLVRKAALTLDRFSRDLVGDAVGLIPRDDKGNNEFFRDDDITDKEHQEDQSELSPIIDQLIELSRTSSIHEYESLSRGVDFVLCRLIETAWRFAKYLLWNDTIRHGWIAVYLLGTTLRGVVRDGLLTNGIQSIDDVDFRDWLKRHQCVSAPPGVSYLSPPVLGIHDLTFSRKSGLSAGTTLLAAYRMVFDYAGHFVYKMRAGMGDTVFAPIHEVLRDRNVEFRWMHEVTKIKVGDDSGEFVIDEVEFHRPVDWNTLNNPTVPVKGTDGQEWRVWPSAPPTIANSPHGSYSIKRGDTQDGFDICVLGIAVGGLSDAMVGELKAASPAFDRMLDNKTVVGTLAMQLWIDKTATEMGWPSHRPGMLISYQRPFNSWVDMSHLLEAEAWGQEGKYVPKSIQYFVDELLEGEANSDRDVRALAIDWLQRHAPRIWPGFGFDDLHDELGRDGVARMDVQYFRANHLGSDRYVTYGPGSITHRIAPGGTDFRNLAIVGDWVKTDFSTGSLESAVLGGLGGAQAILQGDVEK